MLNRGHGIYTDCSLDCRGGDAFLHMTGRQGTQVEVVRGEIQLYYQEMMCVKPQVWVGWEKDGQKPPLECSSVRGYRNCPALYKMAPMCDHVLLS